MDPVAPVLPTWEQTQQWLLTDGARILLTIVIAMTALWALRRVIDRVVATMTSRSARRLAEEGCHWQQLKDELRRDLAIHHLAQARLSVAEVASRLGFAEPSAFHRAFRQWTGGAPGDYRPPRALLQQPRADP